MGRKPEPEDTTPPVTEAPNLSHLSLDIPKEDKQQKVTQYKGKWQQ